MRRERRGRRGVARRRYRLSLGSPFRAADGRARSAPDGRASDALNDREIQYIWGDSGRSECFSRNPGKGRFAQAGSVAGGLPMIGRLTSRSASVSKANKTPRIVRIGVTGRLFLLVILAVVPALVIQAWNEYDQRIAREDDIRQHVIEISRQFGEEIGVLREGARQLLRHSQN